MTGAAAPNPTLLREKLENPQRQRRFCLDDLTNLLRVCPTKSARAFPLLSPYRGAPSKQRTTDKTIFFLPLAAACAYLQRAGPLMPT